MRKRRKEPYLLLEISKEDESFRIYAEGIYETKGNKWKMQRIIGDSANSIEEFYPIIKSILKDYENHFCYPRLATEEIGYIQENVLTTLIERYNIRLSRNIRIKASEVNSSKIRRLNLN